MNRAAPALASLDKSPEATLLWPWPSRAIAVLRKSLISHDELDHFVELLAAVAQLGAMF